MAPFRNLEVLHFQQRVNECLARRSPQRADHLRNTLAQSLPENLTFAETSSLDSVSDQEREFRLKPDLEQLFFHQRECNENVMDCSRFDWARGSAGYQPLN